MSRSRGRVREQQDQSAEASQVASDEKTSAEDEDSEAKENGVGGVTGVPKARVRQPPSLASVVRHRLVFSVEISMQSHLLF